MVRTVLAFGSFDIVHPGHLSYLESARKLGSRLIVIVARDSSIRMLKHRDPVFSERERVRLIGALKPVDLAVLGNRIKGKEGIYRILKRFRPDVIALGYDQQVDVDGLKGKLKEYGIDARVVRIGLKGGEENHKSSRLARLL